MTRERADIIVRLALAVALVIAGSGIGYYYGVFLPDQTRAESEREREQAAAAKAEATKAAKAQAKQEEARQLAYQDCLNTADLAYRARWTASCRAQQQRDIAALQDCRDDWFRSDKGCMEEFPVRPERDCALPPETAAAYAADLDREKAQCSQPAPMGDPAAPRPASISG